MVHLWWKKFLAQNRHFTSTSTLQGCSIMNKKRLIFAEYQNRITSKKQRKVIRGCKKKKKKMQIMTKKVTYMILAHVHISNCF